MLDFIAGLGPEFARIRQIESDREADRRRWNARLREIAPGGSRRGRPSRKRRIFGDGEANRRRALFATALDEAQREGITIDAWFGYKFADPALSARAEWAGLIDDAAKSARDGFAA